MCGHPEKDLRKAGGGGSVLTIRLLGGPNAACSVDQRAHCPIASPDDDGQHGVHCPRGMICLVGMALQQWPTDCKEPLWTTLPSWCLGGWCFLLLAATSLEG